MEYTVTYKVDNLFPEGRVSQRWWAVVGVVTNSQGEILASDDFTARTRNETWVRKVFADIYQKWNDDPRFNRANSGDVWRDVIVLP